MAVVVVVVVVDMIGMRGFNGGDVIALAVDLSTITLTVNGALCVRLRTDCR